MEDSKKRTLAEIRASISYRKPCPISDRFKQNSSKLLKQQVPIIQILNKESEGYPTAKEDIKNSSAHSSRPSSIGRFASLHKMQVKSKANILTTRTGRNKQNDIPLKGYTARSKAESGSRWPIKNSICSCQRDSNRLDRQNSKDNYKQREMQRVKQKKPKYEFPVRRRLFTQHSDDPIKPEPIQNMTHTFKQHSVTNGCPNKHKTLSKSNWQEMPLMFKPSPLQAKKEVTNLKRLLNELSI